MNKILDEIRPIFVHVLGDVGNTISLDTVATDVEGWDSFAHISIVVEIEEKYGVAFGTEELGKMTCVNDFCVLLADLIKKKSKNA